MSEPRSVAAAARRYGLSRSLLVAWRALAADRSKSDLSGQLWPRVGSWRRWAASSESATAHSTERPIEINWLAAGASLSCGLEVEALRRMMRLWSRDVSNPYESSGAAGHGHTDMRRASPHCHCKCKSCYPAISRAVICSASGRRGDLLKVIWHDGQEYKEEGRWFYMALARGRRGVDLAGTDELSLILHRLVQLWGLASNQRGLRV
ncbi:hypothetical protein QA641_37565 [Bradyrhizobium sp. CB1650]|uniref:hypothetical protein n=1 Tax=Bradyrhizobium sp. CB1650 TaxID=3039153 RepID=UPI002435EA76|nr:hypothetical protein [Bradyrhizobium sp. CB1650]WGD56774.1 hypothetical protein QA641_37565 [Bradyrhizobium sp. CB1650]